MRTGRWRHISSLDLDMLVVKVSYRGVKYIKCHVLWINRHYKDLILFPTPETVKVQVKDLRKWKWVSE